MKTLQVIVQKAGKGVSAHLPEVDGYVISRPTFEKLKKDIRSGLQFHIEGLYPEERAEWMDGDFGFVYQFEDIPSLLESYNRLLNHTVLARIAGINESLMRQYVLGIKRPGAKVKQRILDGLKIYANELLSVNFAQ